MAKNNKVPRSKNLKRSAAYISSRIIYTTMPSLASTAVSAQEAYNDLREFTVKSRSKLRTQSNQQRQNILKPVKEIIENAKSDIKSGKLYNPDRGENSGMSDFIDDMTGEDNTYNDSQDSMSLAPFDKILSTSSARSLMNAKSINEIQIKSAEYLGELQEAHHNQSLLINQRNHIEITNKLDNLEKIGLSLVEFNVKTMNEHIKATHSFYNEILDETRELRESVSRMAESINSRFGVGRNKRQHASKLESIFGSGSFDISAYTSMVKGNIKELSSFTDMAKDYLKDIKKSPISSMLQLIIPLLIPTGVKKGMGNLDKSIQGVFAKFLRTMGDWKSSNNMLKSFIGDIFGVKMGTSTKPGLSQYKNMELNAELELKKAKAITEVIPQYLSEITKKLTGKNMVYNYDKAVFVDRDKARASYDKDLKSSVIYTMNDTKKYFDSKMRGVASQFAGDAQTKEILYEDVDNFVFWLSTHDADFSPKKSAHADKEYVYYNKKFNLFLRGGWKSYAIIRDIYFKTPPSKRSQFRAERISANIQSKNIMDRWNEDLISSGMSAVYNGMDTIPKAKNGNMKFKSKHSDIQDYIARNEMSAEEYAIFEEEYNREKNKALGKSNKSNSKYTGFIGKIANKYMPNKFKNKIASVSDIVEDLLNTVSDKISVGSERIFDTRDSGSEVYDEFKSNNKAKIIGKKRRNKSKGSLTSKKSPNVRAIKSSIIPGVGIDYRPYFEVLDSHLRHIATLTERNKSVGIEYGQAGIPVMVDIASIGGYGPTAFSSPMNPTKSMNAMLTQGHNIVKYSNDWKYITGSTSSDDVGIDVIHNKRKSILQNIKDGIASYGGNAKAYFKSLDFKDLINNTKNKTKSGINSILGIIKNALSSGKDMAGTLFSSLKDKIAILGKKGKGAAIGAAISSILGLGAVPGAVIGALFSKKPKKKSTENKEIEENIENMESGKGFFEKFKANKKKSVLMGSAVSSMLGLGPIPGAIATMFFNKHFVKKKPTDEKETEEMANSVENAEKKVKGLGAFKKGKNLATGAVLSSMLGLGPMPGLLVAQLYNKHKDKSLKNKNIKEAEGAAEAMDNADKQQKEGILTKIGKFFGKSKNLALGAIGSSLLGLGPIPGIVVASIYNKHKYKKKNITAKDVANDIANDTINKSNTVSRANKSESRRTISYAEKMRDAEAKGNQAEVDRQEVRLLNEAKASGDINKVEQATNIVANTRNSTGIGNGNSGDKKSGTSEKKGSLFSSLFNKIKNGASYILPLIAGVVGLFAGKGLNKFADKLKEWGFGGQNTTNAQGDANFANFTDDIDQTGNLLVNSGTAGILSVANKVLRKHFGTTVKTSGLIGNFMGMNQSFDSALYYKNEARAYEDRGASTLAQEQLGKSALNTTKGIYYGAKFVGKSAKIIGKVASESNIASAIGRNAIKLLEHPTVIKFFEKTGLKKLINSTKTLIKKIVFNATKKIGTKAPSLLAKVGKVALKYFPLVTAIASFISGWNNAYRDYGLDPNSKVFIRVRLANALVYALDDLLCGALDILGLRDNISESLMKLFLFKDEEAEITKSQQAQLNNYEKFLKDNDLNREGFTQDMYNKMTNKSIWGNIKSVFTGDELDKYKSGGAKNADLKSKYGGYSDASTINIYNYDGSTNNNIMQDITGSGGRGIAPNNVIRNAISYLQKGLYNKTNSRVISDKELNKSVNSNIRNTDSKGSKGNIFSRMGNAIKNAASGAWNWIKGLFGGSGGRGDDPNYYNQADPRWANQYFGKYNGKRDTIKDGGCGPTVAAMALQELSGHTVTPSDMANLALTAGYKIDNGGTTPDFFNAAGSLYGYNFDTEKGISETTKAALKAGIPVPLLGKNGPYGPGDHYLLANGMNSSGKVSILDPQNRRNNKKFSLKELSKTTNASMVPSTISNIYGRSRNNKYVKRINKFMGRSSDASTATEMQLKVVQNALSRVGETTFRPGDRNYSKGKVSGYCLGLASDIYAACGYKFTRYSDPRAVKAKDPTYSSDISNIPLGATVLFPSKTKNGHAGIYIGNGEIVHAWTNGVIKTSIQFLIDSGYNEVGWSWQNGKPMGSASDYSGVDPSSIPEGVSDNNGSNGQTILQSILSSLSVNSKYSNILSSLSVNSKYTSIIDSLNSFEKTIGSSNSPGSVSGVSDGTLGSSMNRESASNHKVTAFSTITADQLRQAIRSYNKKNTWMETQVDNILKASEKSGLDPRFLIANAAGENGWEKQNYARYNSFFNIGAFDSNPDNTINYGYPTELEGWVEGAKWIKENYADAGQDSLYLMKNHPTHAYQTGSIDTKADIYSSLINLTGGSGGRGTKPGVRPFTKYIESTIDSLSGISPINAGRGKAKVSTPRAVKTNIASHSKFINNKGGRGDTASIPFISTSSHSTSNNGNEIISILKEIANTLISINDKNEIISNKEFSPQIVVPQNSNSFSMNNNHKASLVDSIISGI